MELATEVRTTCGEGSNVARYRTWPRGRDQPTRYAVAALIHTACEQGGR